MKKVSESQLEMIAGLYSVEHHPHVHGLIEEVRRLTRVMLERPQRRDRSPKEKSELVKAVDHLRKKMRVVDACDQAGVPVNCYYKWRHASE